MTEIRRIFKKEANKKKFRRIKLTIRSAPLCLLMTNFHKFHLWASARPFLSDIGHRGEGPAVQQILDGTYIFPLDTPPVIAEEFQTRHAVFILQIHCDHYGCAAYDENYLNQLMLCITVGMLCLFWLLECHSVMSN